MEARTVEGHHQAPVSLARQAWTGPDIRSSSSNLQNQYQGNQGPPQHFRKANSRTSITLQLR